MTPMRVCPGYEKRPGHDTRPQSSTFRYQIGKLRISVPSMPLRR